MKIINLNIMVIIFLIIIISCRKNNTVLSSNTTSYENISNKKLSSENECLILDSLRMMITEYQGINIYTEDMMRGEGVLELFIENNIKILNTDKTLFGSIQLTKDGYHVQFPKKIIVREMFPQSEYKVFSFDSETPNIDKDFLIIYINKEKKMVDKKSVKFKFIKWNDYIKSAFVKTYDSKNEHWYKAIEIKNDSMLVKSVSSANCDYFEDHKEETKWIKWKNNKCKEIELSFCY